MHGGKSMRNSLAVPATVKSERHPAKSPVELRPGKVRFYNAKLSEASYLTKSLYSYKRKMA